jgi:hypothetical protein
MGSLNVAHATVSHINEILNNIVKHNEETHSLVNTGAPTCLLREQMSQLESLANRISTVNSTIRMMQELTHSLGQVVKVNKFHIKEIEKGRKQYIDIDYEFKLPQYQSPTVLSLRVGYAHNKFAVIYNNNSEPFIVSAKVFREKWWPKIVNGILNNTDKL